MPSTPPRTAEGVQAWLIGGREDVAAAVAALSVHFVLVEVSAREPMPGGKSRQFLRATPRIVPAGDTRPEQEQECATLFPLPSAAT